MGIGAEWPPRPLDSKRPVVVLAVFSFDRQDTMDGTFIHLHNHSEFSILDGAVKTKALVEAAYQHNMPALSLIHI